MYTSVSKKFAKLLSSKITTIVLITLISSLSTAWSALEKGDNCLSLSKEDLYDFIIENPNNEYLHSYYSGCLAVNDYSGEELIGDRSQLLNYVVAEEGGDFE